MGGREPIDDRGDYEMQIRIAFSATRIGPQLRQIAEQIELGRTYGPGWRLIDDDDPMNCPNRRREDGVCTLTRLPSRDRFGGD